MARFYSWIVCLLIVTECTSATSRRDCDIWGKNSLVPRKSRFKSPTWDDAHLGSWPWVGALERWTNNSFQHACVVTLINKRWALTVAECVPNIIDHQSLRLKFGFLDRRGNITAYTQIRRVNAIEIDRYNQGTNQGKASVTLLQLNNPITITHFVKPIPISFDTEHDVTETSDYCYVVGWGAKHTERLQQFQSSILKSPKCRIPEERYSRNKEFCVQHHANPEETTEECRGSVGSPVMCRTTYEQYFAYKEGVRKCVIYQFLNGLARPECLKLSSPTCRTNPSLCETKGICSQVWRLVGVVPNGIFCGRQRGVYLTVYTPRTRNWILSTLARDSKLMKKV